MNSSLAFLWTNLKAKSSTERAYVLIGLADPAFRDKLTAYAKAMHII